VSKRFDLVVRGGVIVDGTGATPREGDVAVSQGCIAAVGRFEGCGTEEIDAKGRIVTPGFVDIHTHYDGQAVWDRHMAPSAWHGVTTAVMGNCGVGFAPCKPADREKLIELMEGVEDIPGPVMHEGLNWQWESFQEYVAALDRNKRDIDLCALLPHAAVRVYVMGERAIRHEAATVADRRHAAYRGRRHPGRRIRFLDVAHHQPQESHR
jgi:N-acyl-D-aspartate/D-glutamate deacylase